MVRVSCSASRRHVGTDRRSTPILPGDGGAQRAARARDPMPARSHPDWRSRRRRRHRPTVQSRSGPPEGPIPTVVRGPVRRRRLGPVAASRRPPPRPGSRRHRRTRRPWWPRSPGRWRGLSPGRPEPMKASSATQSRRGSHALILPGQQGTAPSISACAQAARARIRGRQPPPPSIRLHGRAIATIPVTRPRGLAIVPAIPDCDPGSRGRRHKGEHVPEGVYEEGGISPRTDITRRTRS